MYLCIYVHTVGKERQGENKPITPLSVQHLGITQHPGCSQSPLMLQGRQWKRARYEEWQPIRAAGSEGKLKQGVSSNCPYPVQGTGLGNAKQRQEERRPGHLGTNPPSPRDAAPIQDPGLTPASLLALLFFFILRPGVTICPGFQGAWRGGSGGRCARGGCGVARGLCCLLGPGSAGAEGRLGGQGL